MHFILKDHTNNFIYKYANYKTFFPEINAFHDASHLPVISYNSRFEIFHVLF